MLRTCSAVPASRLIGCERRGRKARLMEIDPKYADCIVRRYQEYTGKQATLDGDGRTFDEIAEERMRSTGMNRALPTRDRGNRSRNSRRQSGSSGLVSGAVGLVCRIAHPPRRENAAEAETPGGPCKAASTVAQPLIE